MGKTKVCLLDVSWPDGELRPAIKCISIASATRMGKGCLNDGAISYRIFVDGKVVKSSSTKK